jgi:hypothetical protein
MTPLSLLQVLAEDCWFLFLQYNHSHFDRQFVMRSVIHFQFVRGAGKALCQALTALRQEEADAADAALHDLLPPEFLKRAELYKAQTELNPDAMQAMLRDAEREPFEPATEMEELVLQAVQEALG